MASMMGIEALASRNIHTTLNYYQRPDQPSELYHYVGHKPPLGVPADNISIEPHPTIIYDARGKQDEFGLDISGFQWVNHPSAEKAFVNKEKIRTVYYAEVEDILKKYTGAKRVFIFNHTIRKGPDPQIEATTLTAPGPATSVHCDHTPADAEQKVKQRLPNDAERLLKGRYRIINVWRPIANAVAHYPLGVVDFRTVDVNVDLMPLRLIFPKSNMEAYNIAYNPGHKWYYLSDQTPDEVLLIKCFDSDTDKAMLSPHSAFPDMMSAPDAPHRQSIEVRALVFDRE